jgi:hypothetical protein
VIFCYTAESLPLSGAAIEPRLDAITGPVQFVGAFRLPGWNLAFGFGEIFHTNSVFYEGGELELWFQPSVVRPTGLSPEPAKQKG